MADENGRPSGWIRDQLDRLDAGTSRITELEQELAAEKAKVAGLERTLRTVERGALHDVDAERRRAEAAEARATTSRQEALEVAARVADEQAAKLRSVMDLADTGGFDLCAVIFKACSKAADDMAAAIRALATPPASSSPSSSETTPAG